MLHWMSKPNREKLLAEDGTQLVPVLDAIWCFKSYSLVVISSWRWKAGIVRDDKKANQGRKQLCKGRSIREPSRCFPFAGWALQLWREPSGATLCNSAGRGGCAGRGQGNESGQANIKCLKLCFQCQMKEPWEDEWKWSHFHLPVDSGRALCWNLNWTCLCLFA